MEHMDASTVGGGCDPRHAEEEREDAFVQWRMIPEWASKAVRQKIECLLNADMWSETEN